MKNEFYYTSTGVDFTCKKCYSHNYEFEYEIQNTDEFDFSNSVKNYKKCSNCGERILYSTMTTTNTIPTGYYCYTAISVQNNILKVKPCPFYHHIEGEVGFYNYLHTDIFDQVKDCGINENLEEYL